MAPPRRTAFKNYKELCRAAQPWPVVGIRRELPRSRDCHDPQGVNVCTRYNHPVNLDDTIVAIATPPGRGGIGVVRLAGPQARSIATPMLRLKHELGPGRAAFGELIEPGGGRLAREDATSDSEISTTEK